MPAKRKRAGIRDWLPLAPAPAVGAALPTGEAFRAEWIDFERGIRVGNLEPEERITQILKRHLETTFHTPFVIDRWGRGVFWQWICWLPRVNREAKPLSHDVNFGCSKLFITVGRAPAVFKCGLQIERGYAGGPEPFPGCRLKEDWDWHRLVRQCAPGTVLDRELKRLIRKEGFVAEIGDWEANAVFNARNFKSAPQLREALQKYPPREWVGFQLYYPMPASELKDCAGPELVTSMEAAFAEVIPAMNACMQVPLGAGQPVH